MMGEPVWNKSLRRRFCVGILRFAAVVMSARPHRSTGKAFVLWSFVSTRDFETVFVKSETSCLFNLDSCRTDAALLPLPISGADSDFFSIGRFFIRFKQYFIWDPGFILS
jgi:hypothetical protein